MTNLAVDLIDDQPEHEKRALAASLWCVRIITLSFLVQIFLSVNLWMPQDRSYPEIPVLDTLAVDYADWLTISLTVVFMMALVLSSITTLWRQPILILGLCCLGALLLEDVNRFQPWVYVYSALLTTITWYRWRNHPELQLAGLQFILSMVYFWTGVHKLNVQFIHDVYPWLVGVYPWTHWLGDYLWLGYGMGLLEIVIGVALLFVRSRRVAVVLGILLHTGILAVLIKDGWNTIVYPWNLAMMGLLYVLFWYPHHCPTFRTARRRPNFMLLLLFGMLPSLYLAQQLPVGLSLALYSGTAMECDLMIETEGVEACIPEHVRHEVLYYGEDERLLSLDSWGMANLNIPPFASEASYREVARQFCTCAVDYGGHVTFYYPMPWKNEDQRTTLSCTQLLREE